MQRQSKIYTGVKSGFLLLDLLLAMALAILIISVSMGAFRQVAGFGRSTGTRALGLRDQVWDTERIRLLALRSSGNSLPRELMNRGLDAPFWFDGTHVRVRFRPDHPAWIVTTLPLTKRWPA